MSNFAPDDHIRLISIPIIPTTAGATCEHLTLSATTSVYMVRHNPPGGMEDLQVGDKKVTLDVYYPAIAYLDDSENMTARLSYCVADPRD